MARVQGFAQLGAYMCSKMLDVVSTGAPAFKPTEQQMEIALLSGSVRRAQLSVVLYFNRTTWEAIGSIDLADPENEVTLEPLIIKFV